MTKKECEARIFTLMKRIKEVCKCYSGNCNFLALVIMDDYMEFYNRYYGEDSDFPINYCYRDSIAVPTQSKENEDD